MKTIAVIGCGKQGRKHVGALKKIDDINVIIADEDREIAGSFAKSMNVPMADNSLEVLANNDVTAVDICTPTSTHKDLIIGALQAGKHVFCEKPLCLSISEAQSIQESANATDLVTMIGYHHRFHPAYQVMKQVIEGDIIGQPHFALFRMGGRGSHQHWKHLKDQGGGAINEIFVHKLALILWYFGKIKKIRWLVNELVLPTRTIAGKALKVDAEDCVVFQMESENGAQIICQADLVTPCFMDFTEIHGSNGSVCGSILHYMPTVVFCEEARGTYNRGNNIFQFPMQDLFKSELQHFIAVINGKKGMIGTVDESIIIMKTINELYKNQPDGGSKWITL